jgi:hypothetical protein
LVAGAEARQLDRIYTALSSASRLVTAAAAATPLAADDALAKILTLVSSEVGKAALEKHRLMIGAHAAQLAETIAAKSERK